ncbi:MAG: DUF952 domain-containing protein [Ferruginibacter sp.]
MIYHVTTRKDWAAAQAKGFYDHPSLAAEGFIHNCSLEQLPGVLDRYYKGVPELILLHIDETKLQAPLKYELAPSVNDMFPHIFGNINLDAVVNTQSL